MNPNLNFVLFQVSAYGFFTVAALGVVVVGSYRFALKRGFSKADTLLMLLGMALAVFVGARVLNIVVHYDWYREDPSRVFSLTATGFSLYGGIIFAIIAGGLIGLLRKIPLLKFADAVTPFLGLGIALMRVGCFLNGCCFGKVTNLPWGVTFPPLSPAHLHQMSGNIMGSLEVQPVHPTQLYELLAALGGAVLASVIIKRKMPDGAAFLVFGIYFSAFRWLNMQFRVLPYSETVINLWYPALYAAIMVVCGYFVFRVYNKKKSVHECIPNP